MNGIKVRIATRDDAQSIANFNVIFAKKIINKKLSLPTTVAGVHHVFQTFNNGFYLVAEENGKIVGATMVTHEWSDWNNGLFYCIQSIYVDENQDKDFIHDALFNKAKDLAKEHSEVFGIRVYVDESNDALKNRYKDLGLKKTKYIIFEEEFK